MDQPEGLRYRPDIDGLRGIAVLSVVAFHAAPRFSRGGFAGVDIFFVISGFLISSIIFQRLDTGTFTFADFYERRIRRIFPALIVVLLACLLLGWLVLLSAEYRLLGKHTAAAAGFFANFVFWRETGYFETPSQFKPLLHLWSLGIEEQFYLVWPVFLFLLWKRKRTAPWAIGLVTLLSFALNIWLFDGRPRAAFYLPFTRLWELSIGALLGYFLRFGSFPSRRTREAAAWTGALLIAFTLVFLNSERLFPGWWAMAPVAGAAMLILAGPDAWVNRRVLQSRALVAAGLISYPLYLWHWPLLSFANIVATIHHAVAIDVACIAVSVLLSWMTWRYVERTIRARRGLRSDVAMLAAGMALAGCAGVALLRWDGAAGRSHIARAERAMSVPGGPPRIVPCADRRAINVSFCFQSKSGPVDAAIIGDSHAKQLLPGLAGLDTARNWLAIGSNACPPVLGVSIKGPTESDCVERMQPAFDYVAKHVAPGIVVLSFYGYYTEAADFAADHVASELGPSRYRFGAGQEDSREEVLFRGLSNAIGPLMKRHKAVVLFIDIPDLPFLPRDCLRPFAALMHGCTLERDTVDRRQRGLRSIAGRLKREWPTLVLFDPLSMICSGASCTPIKEEFSFYRDSHHLSPRGSLEVARVLLGAINAPD